VTAEREEMARKIMKQNSVIDAQELADEKDLPLAVDAAHAAAEL
jgi:hypothetical protein